MVNKKLTNRLAQLIQRKPQVCFNLNPELNSYNYLILSKFCLVTPHKTYERKIDSAVCIDIFFAAISIRILPISCSNKMIRFSSSSIESREISSPTITSPAPATVNSSSLIRYPFCFRSYFILAPLTYGYCQQPFKCTKLPDDEPLYPVKSI